jgi:hypothetical protein
LDKAGVGAADPMAPRMSQAISTVLRWKLYTRTDCAGGDGAHHRRARGYMGLKSVTFRIACMQWAPGMNAHTKLQI